MNPDDPRPLTIEQRVTGEAACVWHVVIVAGEVTYHDGPALNPTVTLSGSRSTISAIRSGEKSAQRAFLDGDLKVGGDITMLLAATVHLEAAQKSSEAN